LARFPLRLMIPPGCFFAGWHESSQMLAGWFMFHLVKMSLPFFVMRKLYSSSWCTITISLLP
jgi:hypothetical protein